ncbi:MAG: hypothetical protein ACTSVI_07880 [Promethearchaeota archaeon]
MKKKGFFSKIGGFIAELGGCTNINFDYGNLKAIPDSNENKDKMRGVDADKCYYCNNRSFTTCVKCGKPICHVHMSPGNRPLCPDCFSKSVKRRMVLQYAIMIIMTTLPFILFMIFLSIMPLP